MPIDSNVSISVNLGRQDNVRVFAPIANSAKAAAKGVEGISRERQELTVAAQSLPQEPDAADPEQLRQAVQEINSVVQNLQRDLQFKVDTESGMTIISVIDSETKEVIRQLPPEEVLERAKRMDEAAKGEFPVDGLLLKMKI